MSIGLYDDDFMRYAPICFNLDLMKLSAYYKKRKEVVVLAPELEPERYTHFIFRKDYDDGYFDKQIFLSNVDYGGHAFTKAKYKSLPEFIQLTKPDKHLYDKFIYKYQGTKKLNNLFHTMIRAEHIRLSLDGENIWEDYNCQFKFLSGARNIIFHDYDLGKIKGSCQEIKNILARARTDGWATRVGMKFPVTITTGEELLEWISILPNSNFYFLKFYGVIDDINFEKFVTSCKERSTYSQMEYWITGNKQLSESQLVSECFQQLYRQIVLARNQRVFFSLKYDDNYFKDKRWEKVIDLFNYYHNSYSSKAMIKYLKMIPTDTMFDFASKTLDKPHKYYNGKCFTKKEIRQIFNFVRENNYNLFKDFYEYNIMSLGG